MLIVAVAAQNGGSDRLPEVRFSRGWFSG